MQLEKRPTAELEAELSRLDDAIDALQGHESAAPLIEIADRIEAELDRRDYNAADPASPRNTATDARDTSPDDVMTRER